MRLLIYIVLFYLLYQVVKLIIRSFLNSRKEEIKFPKNPPQNEKYKDAEEVDFIEIKNEKKPGNS